MWKLETDSIVDFGAGEEGYACASFDGQEGDRRQTVYCRSEHPVFFAENDHHLVWVWGRLRPYGMDYDLNDPARWLLDCIARDPSGFYGAVAGFFAIVLLDKHNGEMRLISDHVGSVPVYFCSQKGRWLLTDSLKTLEAVVEPDVLELNPQALYNYSFNHCIPAPDTIYKGVTKLEPGAELVVSLEGNRTDRTLYHPDYSYSAASASELMAQCRHVIEEAVRRNVVPRSGAFLSGGLDSSTVAGVLAGIQRGAPTFSIGFEVKGYDETEYARLTAGHFGTTHQVHYLRPNEIVENFVDVAGFFDEPFGNSSALATFVCAAVGRTHGVAVMLAGDGGDEIFAGNERYARQKIFEAWSRVPGVIRAPLAFLLGGPLGKLPGLAKGHSYVKQACIPLPDRLDTWNLLNRFGPEAMFEQSFLQQVDTTAPMQAKRDRYRRCLSPDPVERMMYLDWKFTLANNDLVKVSRMCRMAGVDVRYPLFEKEVVDFSCSVPVDMKLPRGNLRDFYKNSFRGFLPDATLSKTKHGFGLPFGVWMKERPPLQQLTSATLDRLRVRGIFRPDFIDTALRAHQSGHSGYYGELIWIMVVLQLWLDSRGR